MKIKNARMNKTKAILLALALACITVFAIDPPTIFRSIRQFSEILIAPGLRISPSVRDSSTNIFTVFDNGGSNFFRITGTGTNALPTVSSNGVPYLGINAVIGATNHTQAGVPIANGGLRFVFRNGLLVNTN